MNGRTRKLALALAGAMLAGAPALAKLAPITLGELVERAQFIGVVRVERVSAGIPLLKKPRATATVLESWKGEPQESVRFVASPSWTCDSSDAHEGEIAVVFVRDGHLEYAGRGRMPVFERDGESFAAFWPEVRMPPDLPTEAGPDPEALFVRGAPLEALRDIVMAASRAEAVE